jgi:hypothetical protein
VVLEDARVVEVIALALRHPYLPAGNDKVPRHSEPLNLHFFPSNQRKM